MLSVILFCFCISALPIFLSSVFNKKFEESLPLSFFGGVFFIYLIGLIANIQIGVFLWLALCCLLYVAALIYVIKNKSLTVTAKNIFTLPFFLFLFLAALLAVLNVGRMPVGWDEFSHWATTVKGMFNINDFAANPLSNDGFGSYPPAMSLLQYAIEVFERFLGGEFSDWKLYYVYQLFAFSLFLPFLKQLKIKKFLLFVIALFLTCVMFDTGVISSLYIDAFIGLLSGALLAYIFILKYDTLSLVTFSLGLFTLILSKEIGLFFAVIIYIAYFAVLIKNTRPIKLNLSKKFTFHAALPLLSCVFAKLSWGIVLAVHNTNIRFSETIPISELFNILIGRTDSEKKHVMLNFTHKFFTAQLVDLNIFSITFFQLLIIFIFIAFAIFALHKKCTKHIDAIPIILLSSMSSLVLYIISLPFIYIFKFTEEEAVPLASFGRYLSIAFTFVGIVLMLSLILIAANNKFAMKHFFVSLLALFLLAPGLEITEFFTRVSLQEKNRWIQDQVNAINEYKTIVSSDNFVPVGCISLSGDFYEYELAGYYLPPYKHEFIPLPEFIDTYANSPKEQIDKGLTSLAGSFNGEYEYVMVFTLTDYFKQNCTALFENPAEMHEHTLYKVSQDTGLLQLVQ